VKQLETRILKILLEASAELRFSQIKKSLLKENDSKALFNVTITKALKALLRDGFLDRTDRGRTEGVSYSIKSRARSRARLAVFLSDTKKVREPASRPE
jgi:predicted transcriptional regulator